ncbi:MATE family efflux transporter [Sporomusa acidovorans]|uniref:Multidrug export protein MepA n=1 Tax=Sporomusa acidovorans (strain ATCC 49682 / DSM 3132 / Mol) TaxID=1123286 RepID=A0ABZ3J4P2_SPOA4|nr:MATE family efflux transporter [Sporomusa acidovorans]OZC15488.1 multidrug export protein MepA [Sporomusa acidovorans DSM 3132]SDE15992.1 putative efflux protein, MATE family [Sporomusa acidovorans]
MDQSEALGQEKISKLLWEFSLPAIVGMVVNALYNVVDSIFVGNGVGDIGLTAVTIAFPIMIILMAIGMLIGIGASTLVSIRLGEQNRGEAEVILGNAFSLMIVAVLATSVLALVFLDELLVLLGAEPHVLPYAREFTRIILLGSIFMHIGFGLNNIIRAEGNPRVAMATMLIAAFLNFILNPLFIFGFKLGIAGSALATVAAQAVAAAWVLRYLAGDQGVLKLRYSNLRLDKNIVYDICKIGLSPFLMQIAASTVTVLFNFSLLRYGGELGVAAIGVINRVGMLILMPIFGISQGVQPILGYNYGAKNYDRVKEVMKLGIYAATVVSIIGFAITQLFSTQIIRLFNDNTDLIAMGANGLKIFTLVLPIVGFQIIGANYFQAAGKAGYAIFLSMSRQVIILIPAIIILPRIFGLDGVWLAMPVSDVVSSILTAAYLWLELRKLSPKLLENNS